MKKLFLILALSFSGLSFAGEVTGVGKEALRVLEQNQMNVQQLKDQGLKVLMGEVTGVGKTIQLDRIEMLVTNKTLFKMNSLSHIEYKHPSAAKTLTDVVHMEFNRKVLSPKQVKMIIYQ